MNYVEKLYSYRMKIKGFENYDASKLLAYVSFARNLTNVFRSIIIIVIYLIIDPFKIEVIPSKSKFIFFQDSSIRKDHKKTCDSIESLFDEISILRKKRNRCIKIDFKFLYFFANWLVFFLLMKISLSRKFMYLSTLCGLYRFKNKIEKIYPNSNNWNVFITFFDGSPIQNLAAQFFKANGCKTITLQHGFFDKVVDKYECDANSIIRGLVSDYFFVWDKKSRDNAVESGISAEKIKIAGPVKYFNSIRKKNFSLNKSFCIYFDGTEHYVPRNRNMLKYGKIISDCLGLHFFVKLHPSNSLFDYPEIKDNCIDILPNDIINPKILNKFDFIIVAGSSLLIESIYVGTPVFRYIDGDRDELFAGISVPTFSNENDLLGILKKFYLNPEEAFLHVNSIRKNLCFPEDVREAYRSAFEKILYA